MSTARLEPLLPIIAVAFVLCTLPFTAAADSQPTDGPENSEVSDPPRSMQTRIKAYLEKAAPAWIQFTDEKDYQCNLVEGWFFTYHQPDETSVVVFDGGYGVFITRQGLVYLFGMGGSGLWCDIIPAPESNEAAQQSFLSIVDKYGGSISEPSIESPVHAQALVFSPRLDSWANTDSLMAFFNKDDDIFALQRFGRTMPWPQDSEEASE